MDIPVYMPKRDGVFKSFSVAGLSGIFPSDLHWA
jgi:hypothetical protein